MVNTTHGLMEECDISRKLGFEENDNEFIVWVEWRLLNHDGRHCAVCADKSNPQPVNGSVLVRRDAHVIMKEPSVVADAIAASLG